MPKKDIHSLSTLLKLGERATEYHSWIDYYGTGYHTSNGHAKIVSDRPRHSLEDVPDFAIQKYGNDLAYNILKDHIELDELREKVGLRQIKMFLINLMVGKNIRCGTTEDGEYYRDFCTELNNLCYWKLYSHSEKRTYMLVVHHINEDDADNRPENRMLCHYICHNRFTAKNRIMDEDTKIKISNANRGQKRSRKFSENQSENRTGDSHPMWNGSITIDSVYNVLKNEGNKSINDIAKIFNCSRKIAYKRLNILYENSRIEVIKYGSQGRGIETIWGVK